MDRIQSKKCPKTKSKRSDQSGPAPGPGPVLTLLTVNSLTVSINRWSLPAECSPTNTATQVNGPGHHGAMSCTTLYASTATSYWIRSGTCNQWKPSKVCHKKPHPNRKLKMSSINHKSTITLRINAELKRAECEHSTTHSVDMQNIL